MYSIIQQRECIIIILTDVAFPNQQGNDIGTQYRSSIFYTSDNQKASAENVIKKVDASKHWDQKVVTEIVAFDKFYPAEESHQKYLEKNPNGYSCHFKRNFNY